MINRIDDICCKNPVDFWKYVKSLGPRKNCSIPLKVTIDNEIVCDLNVVKDKWKHDFMCLYNPTSNAQVEYDEEFYRDAKSTVQLLEHEMQTENYVENVYLNYTITMEELNNVVCKLKCKKATGADNIPNEVLKRII